MAQQLRDGIADDRSQFVKEYLSLIPELETLSKELEAFRTKVTADRNETFSAWREKDHDDLVLAAALAIWVASRERVYDPDPYALQHDPAPVPDPSPWGAGPERDPFA